MLRDTRNLLFSPSLWVFFFSLTVYLLSTDGNFFISDGEVMYQTTDRLYLTHRLDLPENKGLPQILPGVGGKFYSKYGLGQPLAAIPFYAFGRVVHDRILPRTDPNAMSHFFVTTMNAVVTALTAVLVFAFGRRFFGSVRLGIGLALLYGLGTTAWPYSKFFFSEPLFALCTTLAVYALYLARLTSAKGSRFSSGAWIALAGAATGYALLIKISGAVLLPLLLLYLIYVSLTEKTALLDYVETNLRVRPVGQTRRSAPTGGAARLTLMDLRVNHFVTWGAFGGAATSFFALLRERWSRLLVDLVLFDLPLALFLAMILWHNYLRFGNLFDNGYAGESFTTPFFVGLFGLLLSSGKSIFLYSPVVVLAIFAFPWFYRRFPAEALLFLGLSAATVFYYAPWWAWYGGWSWGPRFLVPILPLLIIPIGVLLRDRRFLIVAFAVLLPLSIFVQFLGVAVDFNTYIIKIFAGDYANEAKYLFIPWMSPLVGHLQHLLEGGKIVISSFRLDQLGFPPRVAQALSTLVLAFFLLSAVMLGLAWVRDSETQSSQLVRSKA
ncbi:MAG: phospholipid carrier-dependent glycosyltransferase [Chloroflexi bacterium]|nr:phospholipid carrier-dependent glycosyltransferase [Chloroflexota bacterium]